jgi:hypothetical protein
VNGVHPKNYDFKKTRRASMLGPLLRYSFLLGLGFLQFCVVQEPSSKPEAPAPKTTPAPVALPKISSPGAARERRAPEPETVADLAALATSLAAYISVAGCQPKNFNVVVTNYTLPDGNTSAFGIQFADELSLELASRENQLRVIDRGLLQSLL